MTKSTTSRALHDIGLAAWFGGTLANAIALNPAAAEATRASDAGAVANSGWDRWTPVNAAAIGAYLAGSVGQLASNSQRVQKQDGVAGMAVLKTGLTVASLAITGYSRVLGKKVSQQRDVPVASGAEPAPQTPPEVAAAQGQLKRLQWLVPAVTGALIVVSSYAGEQQRPSEAAPGLLRRRG